jgi:hypothetical protein
MNVNHKAIAVFALGVVAAAATIAACLTPHITEEEKANGLFGDYITVFADETESTTTTETNGSSVTMLNTKYSVSKPTADGKYYMLLVTAFNLEEFEALGYKNPSIGYTIQAENEEAGYYFSDKYYEAVVLGGVRYDAEAIYNDAAYADYKLIVYELPEYQPSTAYTYQAQMKENEEVKHSSEEKKSSARYNLTLNLGDTEITSLVSGKVQKSNLEKTAAAKLGEDQVLLGLYSDKDMTTEIGNTLTVTSDTIVYAKVATLTLGGG